MEFLKILGDISISEEQASALDKFFAEHKEKVQDEFKKSFMESHGLQLNEDGELVYDESKYIKKEDAERAFELFEADAERAFELFEEDAEKAFELFEEDAEKAFDLRDEDLKKEYTENMAKALQEVYTDIEARVKKDFMESKEYKTIQKLKDLIIPLLEDSDSDLIDRIQTISEEKERVEEENKELQKERTIATLLKDIPQEYEETIKTFIEKGKDENEVIERFNAIIEMMESDSVKNKKQDDNEKIYFKKKKTKKEEDEKKSLNEEAVHVFEYETVQKEQGNKKENTMGFTEEQETMLIRAGLL